MSSIRANEPRFLVGGRYRNRIGEYEVLDIVGNQLRVVYDDGTEATLAADFQSRIMSNIALETATFEPYPGAGAAARNRRYFQTVGFLATRITMMEAIVPPRAQAGFVQTYREITGNPPQVGAVGYYVHQPQVDKWGNELRITFDASGLELQGLDFGPGASPVDNPGLIGVSWRINNNSLWWRLLRLGFKMGNQQVLADIRDRIPHAYKGDFDNGTAMAQ